MLKTWLRFVIILMLLPTILEAIIPAQAQALSGRSGAVNSSTSDGSSTQSMAFGFTDQASAQFFLPGKWKYGAENAFGRGYNGKDNYSHARAFLFLEHPVTDAFKLEGSVGAHQLENVTAKTSQTIPVGNFKVSYSPQSWELNLDSSHDYSHLDGAHPGGVSRYLRRAKINPWIRYYWNDRTRSQLLGTYLFINDGNRKSDTEIVSAYAIVNGKHSVWLGGGAQEIAFRNNTWQYWSPTRNIGLGPRLEADFNFGQRLRSTIRASINRVYDKDPNAWGHSYYSYAKLEYGKHDDWKLALVYERIESNVNHYLWFMNQFNLTLEGLF